MLNRNVRYNIMTLSILKIKVRRDGKKRGICGVEMENRDLNMNRERNRLHFKPSGLSQGYFLTML
jgi:hypothetical protein